MKQFIKLPNRLKAIAAVIDDCSSVADIGTDHGFLPVYLAQKRIANLIVASDISAGSLNAARRSAAKYGVAEKIMFITAPGLDGIFELDIDTVVIAGVGGETIAGILKDAPWVRQRNIKLILQPQSKLYVLCRFLYDNEYRISEIKNINDRGRQYTIIQAETVQK